MTGTGQILSQTTGMSEKINLSLTGLGCEGEGEVRVEG